MKLPSSDDLLWARQRRATARAAGGVLDLVLPLRVGGNDVPLFCAHPIVGLSWCYRALLPHVGEQHPVYGLQPRGLRRPEPLPASMAEMARDYADQIRLTQPEGPYHLLGWSLGGNIAFAVAEELERRGHEVGLLAIMDASPNVAKLLTANDSDAWVLYNFVLAEFGYEPSLVAEDPDPEERLLELVRRRPGLGLDEWPVPRVHSLLRVIRNTVAVARGYRPEQVRCPVLFFSAILGRPLEEKLAEWQPLVSQPIEVVEVDCAHRHMLLPAPMSVIGPAVTERLARATVPAG